MRTHQDEAARKGVKIVNCCGFDSIPSDLGAQMMVNHIREKLGRYLTPILVSPLTSCTLSRAKLLPTSEAWPAPVLKLSCTMHSSKHGLACVCSPLTADTWQSLKVSQTSCPAGRPSL